MNPKIRFSKNWNNKLNQKYFTTIRKYSKSRLTYYLNRENKIFDVMLNGKKVCEAKLISAEAMQFIDLPDAFLMVDTGLPLNEAIELFKKMGIETVTDSVIILTFRKVRL